MKKESSSGPATATNSAEAKPNGRHRLKQTILVVLLALQLVVDVVVAAVLVCLLTPLGDRIGQDFVQVDPPARADYVVALGGDTSRAVEAARLMRNGLADALIVTSTGADAFNLARAAETYGVPASKILIDDKACCTADHPRTVADLPGVDRTARFLIVTSPHHTARARVCFAKAGYDNIALHTMSWRAGGEFARDNRNMNYRAINLVETVYETLAWGMYKLKGRL